jgi:hypothetical protein
MNKFEGWSTKELRYITALMADRDMRVMNSEECERDLYLEIVKEIRNRRVKEELFQMKLKGIEEE